MKAAGEQFVPNQCDVYLVHQSDAAQMQAFVVAERLRDAGLDVEKQSASATGAGSIKSQMKRADASGAAYAVIIGEDELARGKASVTALRAGAADSDLAAVRFEGVGVYLVVQIGDAGDLVHSDHALFHPLLIF